MVNNKICKKTEGLEKTSKNIEEIDSQESSSSEEIII